MSVLPPISEKKQGMEMGVELQERSRPLCWPHLNGAAHHNLPPIATLHHSPSSTGTAQQNNLQPIGTAHHNLPPIAAITSCRPSSSPALKTPIPSASLSALPKDRTEEHVFTAPQPPTTASSPSPKPLPNPSREETGYPSQSPPSPRDRKEEHIFTLPNPPRLMQPAARAPTPFPDHPSSPSVFHNSVPPLRLEPRPSVVGPSLIKNDPPSPTSVPILFNVPTKSAFAAVQRVGSDTCSPSSDLSKPEDLGPVQAEVSSPHSGIEGGRHTFGRFVDPTADTSPLTAPPEQIVDSTVSLTPEVIGQPPPGGTPAISSDPSPSLVSGGSESAPRRAVTVTAVDNIPVSSSTPNSFNLHRVSVDTHTTGNSESSSVSVSQKGNLPVESSLTSGGSSVTASPHTTSNNYHHLSVTSTHIPSEITDQTEQGKTSSNECRHSPSNSSPLASHHAAPVSNLQCIPSQSEQYVATSTTGNLPTFTHSVDRKYSSADCVGGFKSQSSQQVPSSDGLRNYSNQSHRYFATPASVNSDSARPFPSPNQRSNLNVATSSVPGNYVSQSNNYVVSNVDSVRSSCAASTTSSQPVHVTAGDYILRSFANPSERKMPQQVPTPSSENYRRFLPPSGKLNTVPSSGDMAHGFSPHAERNRQQIPTGSDDPSRNFSLHTSSAPDTRPVSGHINRNSTVQVTTSTDLRSYPSQSSEKLHRHGNIASSRESSSFALHSEQPSTYHPVGSRALELPRSAPPQSERRVQYPAGPASNEVFPNYTAQNNRVGYSLQSNAHLARNFPPQHDRDVVYSQSVASSSDNLRGYAAQGDRASVASSSNTRPLPPQGLRPSYSPHSSLSSPRPEVPRNEQTLGYSPHATNRPPQAPVNDRYQSFSPHTNAAHPDLSRSDRPLGYSPHGIIGPSETLRKERASGFSPHTPSGQPESPHNNRYPGFSLHTVGPPETARNDRPVPVHVSSGYPVPHSSSRTYTSHGNRVYPSHSIGNPDDLARAFQQQNERGVTHHPSASLSGGSRIGTPPGQRLVTYPHNSATLSPQTGLHVDKGNKFQSLTPHGYPTPTSMGSVTMTPVPQKRPEPTNFPSQHTPRDSFQAYSKTVPNAQTGVPPTSQPHVHLNPQSYPQVSRSPHPGQYHKGDPSRQAWGSPVSNIRTHETIDPFMAKGQPHRPTEPGKQMQHSHSPSHVPRHETSYPQTHYPPIPAAPRDRPQQHPQTGALPRVNPPNVVSVSNHSPRFTSHPSVSNAGYYGSSRAASLNPPDNSQSTSSSPFGASRPISTTVSLPYSPSLPRVNFPSPAAVSFSGSVSTSSASAYATSRTSGLSPSPAPNQQGHPRPQVGRDPSKQPLSNSSQARQVYPYQQPQESRAYTPSYGQPGRLDEAAYRGSGSQYVPTRGPSVETDICRNPFELPAPTSHVRPPTSAGVIKSHQTISSSSYTHKPNEAKSSSASATVGGFPPRSPYEVYPGNSYQLRNDGTKQSDNVQTSPRYAVPSPRTEQRSASGSDERPKQPAISARFPPVPQSNYDLQRQIFDRMTGVQQTPPRLLEKSRGSEGKPSSGYKVEAPPRQKRESPLDLSVKTVRQSADSTRDDVDLYLAKHFSQEPRLASAPKIDFNPNFAGPLVQAETRSNVSLPPMQSIRKFQPPTPMEQSRKRHMGEQEAILPPKIPKVDAWKLAMDEQIEERLKAARQSRHPAAPLTPLHPPAQSVTPTNPDLLQPPARPLNDPMAQHIKHDRGPQGTMDSGRAGARGWSAGVFQPPAAGDSDPERLVQQISQGVMPDTRLLQDRNVVDILRSSLEEKEARLQALQAAARRRQPLPPFDALGVERMCVPPSYQHGQPRGAEPVPIGVEATRNYMRGTPGPGASHGSDPDLDGLAAFLAARIRTKAEMKQMGPSSDHFRPPEAQGGRPVAPSTSPPKLLREGRSSQGPQGPQPRRMLLSPSSEEGVAAVPVVIPRDRASLRSSSETSVFDFRESDSESEMPVLERQTLDGMRRPRKTLPRPVPEAPTEPLPGPAPKDGLLPEADPDWDNACDMFVEQLQKRPIKRSVRKKKPNPKFFANELETPPFLKVKTEEVEIKEEVESQEGKEPSFDTASAIPKSSHIIKQETEAARDSDDDLPPLPPVLKEESSSGEEELVGVTVIKEGKVKLVTRKQRVVASDSEWGSSAADSTSVDESASSSASSDSEEDSEDNATKKVKRRPRVASDSESDEEVVSKGRRTRSRPVSGSDRESDDSGVRTKLRRSRKIVGSDSEGSEHSDSKLSRRTRARLLSESGEDSDTNDTKRKGPRTRTRAASESCDESESGVAVAQRKGRRVQTRQQARSIHPPARMRLRSKKRNAGKGPAFRAGWEDDLIKFKQTLRMPETLINVAKPKKRQGPSSLPDLDDDDVKLTCTKSAKKSKKEKRDQNEKGGDLLKSSPRIKGSKGKVSKEEKGQTDEKSKDRPSSAPPLSLRGRLGVVTRGTGKLLKTRSGLRGSVGMRRSNKAVQNSKRHLNKGKKRLKLRRKFRSGFDYMRRKKKQVPRKERDQPSSTTETKRRERNDVIDISAEVKTWVVNKSAGETILHRAARLGYADVAAYCLESLRFAPSPRDHAGYTPLHEACSRGHVAVASFLLQYGANVSESARGGVRPLHQAAENNHLELVRLLLAYGADPLLATYTGQTALSLASQDDVRFLIQQHLADVQGEDAPKWPFDGPATVFDPKWAVNPLGDPPSPDLSLNEVEMETSKAMLPPLYRLPITEDGKVSVEPSDRWLLLVDLMAYTKAPSADSLLSRLPTTARREMTGDDFRESAVPCNILSAPLPPARKVHLLRYDDAVRKVLDLEVLTISLAD